MRWIAFALAAALGGCGSLDSLNVFGPKDEHLLGERTTVFTSAPEVAEGESKPASFGPARSNSDWPQPGGNAQNDPGHVAFSGGGARAWRTSISGVGKSAMRGTLRLTARPIVSGDRVFVYSPDGSVTALSAAGGGRVWSTSLRPEGERDSAAGGGVTAEGGRVYAATGYGQVVALNAADGSVIWTSEFDTPLRGAPTAGSGKVFVVSQKNQVFAVNQEDGSQAFEYDGIPEQSGLLAAASPAVSGDKVVIPYSSGEVMAFSVASGEPVWQNFVTRPSRSLAVAGLNDVSGSPVIDGSVVYATGVAGKTIAVGLSDGNEVWSANIGSAHTPVVSGSSIFLVDIAGRMVALDKSNGQLLWARPLPREKKRDAAYAGPVLAGGALWAISNDGRMITVDPKSGQITADRKIGGKAYTAPIVAGGQMIFVSDTGEITALR
ncbi:PQQ-binding-like beta-propeller repeat protein [Acuticoccus sp. I52.16.1]|uniref:outer membrane protein assembly factor BamB family protein n=1 Tax=Acuticoccus sp. I52.16.1 TaxID=2928472 RepID=UPI001FD1F692|nr:PQQ-binding-like beta-propeller repeat protein [Acuticoccus sp. I52.16.1]UOM33352.1 PQQ-binding-like beta-propeller repeat protein [Acuticoccus sp. I52.16.1]